MKKIKYLYFLCVLLIMYLITLPIYLQYEVNSHYESVPVYQIDNFKGQNVKKSYETLSNFDDVNNKIFYVVRPNTNQNVDLYQIKYIFDRKSKELVGEKYFPKKLVLENKVSDAESFSQSNGYFFSNIDESQLVSLFNEEDIKIQKVSNPYYNPISRYIVSNGFIIMVVILFTLIINIILSLSNFKQAALLSLHGRKQLSIVQLFFFRYWVNLESTSCLFFLVYSIFHIFVFHNKLTINYFVFYGLVNLTVIIVASLLYMMALMTLSSININETLKNKNYSRFTYILLISLQLFIMVTMPIIFSKTLDYYYEIKEAQGQIKAVSELENYYTFSGTNANLYDALSETQFKEYEAKFNKLYHDNKENSYYFDPAFVMYMQMNGLENLKNNPIQNVVYMNQNYYENLADFSQPKVKLSNQSNETIQVLIPQRFKEKGESIITNLELDKEKVVITPIENNNVLSFFDYYSEYEEDTAIKAAKKYAKQGVNNVIVITEPQNIPSFSPVPTPFLDKYTSSSLFIRLDSLSEMIRLVNSMELDSLVTPESKLEKYLETLQQIEHEYNIALSTLFLSLTATIILSVTTSEVIINVKRKKLSVAYLHGKGIGYTLRIIYILYFGASLASVLLTLTFASLDVFVLSFVIGLFLFVVGYLSLRYMYVTKYKIGELLKGE